MITIALIMLAAIFNAAMDVVTHHYQASVFSLLHKEEHYYNPEYSWMNKYINGDPMQGRTKWFWGMFNIHVAFTDFWHLMKSLMVVCLISAIPFCPTNELGLENWIYYSAVIITLGTIWNLTFNLFYHKIFRL